MDTTLAVILIAAAFVVAMIIGIVVGSLYRKRVSEAQIGSAEEQAKRIVEDGIKAAEWLCKDIM